MSSTNSSIINRVETASKSSKYECLDCENYKRKVKEAEQTVSGRDVLIEMLQGEIKKMEERYKISIDDYELLRFKYCTVVQELGNLKEIHKKLEKTNQKLTKERDNAIAQLEILQKEMEGCKNQCKELLPKAGTGVESGVRGDSLHQNILKEVMNIEVIMQNQNETVNDVLKKVLLEMRGSKQFEDVLQKDTQNGENRKDQNKEDLLQVIEDLNNEISKLNNLVEKLKAENESIKSQLSEKKCNLAQCLDVLEDNHSNLNNLSGSIEMIIKEKETYLTEIGHLKEIIEQKDIEIYDLKNKSGSVGQEVDLDLKKENENLRNTLKDLENELEKLQEEYRKYEEACSPDDCRSALKAITENKNEGPDTFQSDSDLEKENEDLRKALNDCQIELEQLQEQFKNVTGCSPEECRKLAKSMLEGKTENVFPLNERIEELEKNLEQVTLEKDEYENENKIHTQKIEDLTMQLQALEKEKIEMQENMKNNPKIADLENLNSQKELEIKGLKDEINKLKQDNQEQILKDKIEQLEKRLLEIEGEKTKLIQENESFKDQLTNLQNEIAKLQEEDEKQILMFQEKIDSLENSEKVKQEEIDQCCCVIKDIQEQMSLEKNTSSQIEDLENENTTLKEKINSLQIELANYTALYQDCDCAASKQNEEVIGMESAVANLESEIRELEVELCKRECLNEKFKSDIKELEVELCRRQCTIKHLEQCLDKSNQILSECEKEMKDMHSENESLKKDNDSLSNDLRSYVVEVQRTSMQYDSLQAQLAAVNRQSQDMEKEKDKLLQNLQEKSDMEGQLKQVQGQYNSLVEATQQKEGELKESRQLIENLQLALDTSKKEQEKIRKAYKEAQDTLSEEIQKFNEQTDKMNRESIKIDEKAEQISAADTVIKELNVKLEEKERTIKALEEKNRELTSEIAQHKVYLNKLVSDNNILRKAVDKMLDTLVEKLKNFTDNEENISLKSNETIVKDILSSLIDLENSVADPNSTTEKCNCMSVIKSTYKIDGNEQNLPPCKLQCGKRGKDMSQYVDCAVACNTGLNNFCAMCCNEECQKPEPVNGKLCAACKYDRRDSSTT